MIHRGCDSRSMTTTAGVSSIRACPFCKGVPFEGSAVSQLPGQQYPRQRRLYQQWKLRSAPPVAETSNRGVGDEKNSGQPSELQYASALEQGNREDMQDFLDVVEKGSGGFLFAGVFDGHGGEKAADYLSSHLYKILCNTLKGDAKNSDSTDGEGKSNTTSQGDSATSDLEGPERFAEVLKAAFKAMDQELLQWLKDTQEGEEAVSGSTATVVLARKDKIVVANVGDSRAVLSRGGQPQDLSSEHRVMGKSKMVDDEVSRVKSVGGWISDGRVCDILAVSRAFGDPQFKGSGLPSLLEFGIEGGFWDEKFAQSVSFTGDPVVSAPDVTEVDVKPEDEFVILASDGLWDVMSSKEAVNFARKDLQKGRSLQSVVDKLANIAMRRYSTDNIAVVLIDLGGGREGWGKKKTGWSLFGA